MRGDFADIGINPGLLRHTVQVQALAVTLDHGRQVKTPATIATVSAYIETLSGRELQAAQVVNSEVTHRITMRYHPEVKGNMYVIYGSRTFKILWPSHDEHRHTKTVLTVKEVNNT